MTTQPTPAGASPQSGTTTGDRPDGGPDAAPEKAASRQTHRRRRKMWRRLLENVSGGDGQGPGTVQATVVATFICGLIGLVFIILYGLQFGWSAETLSVITVGVLISGAAFMAGAAFGFLFGIPKLHQGGDGAYEANTNLEQISDWLTKILVGVGLIQFREIGAALNTLGDNLSQSLGGTPSSDTMGLAICLYYSIGGFLCGYILTRLLLPAAFRSAEEGLAARVTEIEEKNTALEAKVQEQDELNTRALALYEQQVDVGRRDVAPPAQEELDDAVKKASAVVKLVIFQQARELRRKNWRTNKALSSATIPVLRALIASDDGTNFEYHGQLGYALKDQDDADWEESETELTTAIEIRDQRDLKGWLMYELNRADCRAFRDAAPEDLRADLQAAAGLDDFQERIRDFEPITGWLEARQVTLEDFLAGGPA